MIPRLKFRYVNWRGDEHVYIIEPEEKLSVTRGKLMLSGQVVTRDGDERKDMGNRRRSFELTGLRDVEEMW
jgi:hypothetical protein